MPRLIQTRTRLSLGEQLAASPQIGVYAPAIPFDPVPVAINDRGSGQGMDTRGLFDTGGDLLGGGLGESIDDGTSRSWFPGSDLFANIADWGTELGRTLRLLSSVVMQIVTPSFWIRVAMFNTALVAIIVGVVMFARG